MDGQAFKMNRPAGALEFKTVKPPNMIEAQFCDPPSPKSPNDWFSLRYPWLVGTYGPPVIESVSLDDDGRRLITPVALNELFFAAILGGDYRLGHKVIYLSPEKQWYYCEPWTGIFHPTTPEKLRNLLDAMFIRCCQELPGRTDLWPIFTAFRSEAQLKRIVTKAESLLAADRSFFSPGSIYRRENGPEVYAYFAKQFIKEAVEPAAEQMLTVTQAFQLFQQFCREKGIEPMQRRNFKSIIRDAIHEELGLGLRNDLPDARNKEQSGWKGIRIRRDGVDLVRSNNRSSSEPIDHGVSLSA